MPNNLVIYMSGLCNLKCAYCYAAKMSFKEVIKKKVLLSAISKLLESSAPDKKITFLGGEPFLHFNLLKAALVLIRKEKKSDLPVYVFTNGVLINGKISRFIEEFDINLSLSVNDGFFKENGRASRRLKYINVGKTIVSVVMEKHSAGTHFEKIAGLYEIGFRRIAWSPDITQVWEKSHITALEKEMLKLKKHYFQLIKNGEEIYEIANAYEIMDEIFKKSFCRECLSAVLCPDGNFIPCDKLISADKKDIKKFSSRKMSGGKKKDLFFGDALKYGANENCIMCSIASFAFAKYVAKKDDGEIKKAVKAHMKLSRVIRKNLILFIKPALKYPIFRKVHGINDRMNRPVQKS